MLINSSANRMQSSKNKSLLQILRMLALGCFRTLHWSESPNISQDKQGNGSACAAMWLIRELSFSTLLSSPHWKVLQAQVVIIPRSLRKGGWLLIHLLLTPVNLQKTRLLPSLKIGCKFGWNVKRPFPSGGCLACSVGSVLWAMESLARFFLSLSFHVSLFSVLV